MHMHMTLPHAESIAAEPKQPCPHTALPCAWHPRLCDRPNPLPRASDCLWRWASQYAKHEISDMLPRRSRNGRDKSESATTGT